MRDTFQVWDACWVHLKREDILRTHLQTWKPHAINNYVLWGKENKIMPKFFGGAVFTITASFTKELVFLLNSVFTPAKTNLSPLAFECCVAWFFLCGRPWVFCLFSRFFGGSAFAWLPSSIHQMVSLPPPPGWEYYLGGLIYFGAVTF